MASKLREFIKVRKADIQIALDNEQETYTTLDQLKGIATITTRVDTDFDSVDIELLGTVRTYVDRITTATGLPTSATGSQLFLRLSQPDLKRQYPESCIFKANQPYHFSFSFGIPRQLLPHVCRHEIESDVVREAHLQLPPTLGDRELAASDSLDDLASKIGRVQYGICVSISKHGNRRKTGSSSTLATKTKALRITPEIREQPPVDVSHKDSGYRMRDVWDMDAGRFKQTIGTLVIETTEPCPLSLSTSGATGTQVNLTLRFDPVDETSSAPRLGILKCCLRACTFVASCARTNFPTECGDSIFDLTQTLASRRVYLQSHSMADIAWTTCEARSDSTSPDLPPRPSAGYGGGPYYLAQFSFELKLPTHKTFVPTFHSCLVSRVYLLSLRLGLVSAGLSKSSELRVPIQLFSEGRRQEQSRADSVADFDNHEDNSITYARSETGYPLTFTANMSPSQQVQREERPPEYSQFQFESRTTPRRLHNPTDSDGTVLQCKPNRRILRVFPIVVQQKKALERRNETDGSREDGHVSTPSILHV